MGVFDHLAGAPTVQRLFSAPGGVDHGTFKPGRPFPPIWTPDGDCRFGFTKFGNGYVRGPEGTDFDQFTTAVRAGQIPGVPVDAQVTPQDYYDAMYLAGPAPGSSIYGFYVTVPPAPSEPPPVQPLPPAADPCAAVKADLAASEAERAKEIKRANDAEEGARACGMAILKVKAAAAKARKAMPGKGGGIYRNILVELLGTLEGL